MNTKIFIITIILTSVVAIGSYQMYQLLVQGSWNNYSIITVGILLAALLEYVTFDKMTYIGNITTETVTEEESYIKRNSAKYGYFMMLLILFILYFIAELRGKDTIELAIALAAAFVILPFVEFIMKKKVHKK